MILEKKFRENFIKESYLYIDLKDEKDEWEAPINVSGLNYCSWKWEFWIWVQEILKYEECGIFKGENPLVSCINCKII